MEKVCKKHGLTKYRKEGNSKYDRWRCVKCASEAVQKRRDKVKLLAINYKGGKCEICGYNKYINALEFHHLNPNEKDFGIGQKGYTRFWEKVKIELDKCIMVCSNCHRELHGGVAKLIKHNTVNIEDASLSLATPSKIYKCIDCGIEINRQSIRCVKFSKINQRKVKNRPSNETLLKELEKSSYSALGRKYGVSDNTIRKWLK